MIIRRCSSCANPADYLTNKVPICLVCVHNAQTLDPQAYSDIQPLKEEVNAYAWLVPWVPIFVVAAAALAVLIGIQFR